MDNNSKKKALTLFKKTQVIQNIFYSDKELNGKNEGNNTLVNWYLTESFEFFNSQSAKTVESL